MRIVVALGGNALLRRGDSMTAEKQRENVCLAASQLAPIAGTNELVVCHGNGPQVGLLALQAAAYEREARLPSYPLDVLGAQTQGMIGYLLELELGNRLPFERPLATVLTMIEVDPDDPAFAAPSKFIGPIYSKGEADALRSEKNWTFKPDGESFRRVVPSPRPRRIFELQQIEWLLEKGCVVICAGGGGIPTVYRPGRRLVGVEGVVDKDHASGLLAGEIHADRFLMATDVDAAYVEWGKPSERAIARAHPAALKELAAEFPDGSMGPKVVAACEFAEKTGNPAVIGSLGDIPHMLDGSKGTVVTTKANGVEFASARE